jgi:hypothetical protein
VQDLEAVEPVAAPILGEQLHPVAHVPGLDALGVTLEQRELAAVHRKHVR